MKKNMKTQIAVVAVGMLAAGNLFAATVTVDLNESKPISPLLMGVFFEDLNYAADGGLYAELVENRSFDYSSAEVDGWNPLSFWTVEKKGDAEAQLISDTADPIHPNNPLYAVVGIRNPGVGVGLVNYGFGGMPVKAGAVYDFSVFARQLSNPEGPMTVLLETKDGGEVLARAELPVITAGWKKIYGGTEAEQERGRRTSGAAAAR